MRVFKTLSNYFFYCGIDKEEYEAVKKAAYISNFVIWRILHCFMAAIFGVLFIISMFHGLLSVNRLFYFFAFFYSALATIFFFVMKKDSIIPQFLIYLTITMVFLFGGFC